MRPMIRGLVAVFALGLVTLLAVAPASACDGKTKAETESSSNGK